MTIINERKYFVKMDDRFNLDSMRTHIQCLQMDEYREEHGLAPLDDVEEEKLEAQLEEVESLLSKALYGKVTGKEYGRIREISETRQMIRYQTCIAAGMSEDSAGYSFN